jgi:hypothetical protein
MTKMAKLKAHGKELLRVELEKSTPDGDLTIWERTTKAYMADGKVLAKLDVRFKPDSMDPKGRLYSYGWKLSAKKKKDVSMADYEAAVRRIEAKANEPTNNWKVVSGGMPPVVISQAKILRAVESGDSIGFCKACGAETDGVEPDARNYRCESCGMLEVYGAEEFLIAG